MSSEARRQVARAIAPLLLAAALLAALGCGKKGPPLPPLRQVPAPVKDLKVGQRDDQLLLDFAYPKVTPGGQALSGVSEVEVWAVTRPAPSALPTAPAATATPAPSATPTATPSAPAAPPATAAPPTPPPPTPTPSPTPPAATTPPVPVPSPATPATPAPSPTPPAPAGPQPLNPREFTGAATLRLKLKGPEVGAATQGDRLVVALPLPQPLPAQPELYWFAVRTTGPKGDRSEFSNQAVIQPKAPPPPPATTAVAARADGIAVTWTEPAPSPGAPTPPASPILGYNVYRRDSQVRGFGPPLHAAAATDRIFVDTSARFGQSYIYAVTTVTARQPLLESAIRTEVEVKYVDRFPPPTPREPVALVEAGRVRLVWRASEAPDLAGYRVYRLDLTQVKGEYQRLTESPLSDVQYTDATVTPGTPYAYRVTAIDQAGNESDPAEVRATAQ
jgi:hypothetical protein